MELHQPFITSPALKIGPRIGELPGNHLGSYEDFLKTFLKDGYEFLFFQDINSSYKQLVLRHDVDFDTAFALETAKIEARLGVKSTYFFLLRSNLYNILAPADFENVQEIRSLGHQISVHFDPTIYDDFHQGLQQEVAIFEACFNEKVKIVSFHRPNAFFQEYDSPVMNIEHTYQSKYFRDIKYFSDSTGVWRFGHPADSMEFALGKSLHILIHPIWWVINGHSNLKKLESYFTQRIDALKHEFSNNCIPFRKIHAQI
ncbi:MAG: hypothetical protein IPH04_22145 [Saprospirales bacterium]|nr:hypothetical protein [Saprospirales bacterium]